MKIKVLPKGKFSCSLYDLTKEVNGEKIDRDGVIEISKGEFAGLRNGTHRFSDDLKSVIVLTEVEATELENKKRTNKAQPMNPTQMLENIKNQKRKNLLEETMEYSRRKLDQIHMGVVLENSEVYYQNMYLQALNEMRQLQGKEARKIKSVEGNCYEIKQ